MKSRRLSGPRGMCFPAWSVGIVVTLSPQPMSVLRTILKCSESIGGSGRSAAASRSWWLDDRDRCRILIAFGETPWRQSRGVGSNNARIGGTHENKVAHFRADGSPRRPLQQAADLPDSEFRGAQHSARRGGKGGGGV